MMRPIALFLKGERKSNPAFAGAVTPGQALIASELFLAMSAWALLTVLLGRPTSWFGQFVFCFCATLPVVASPTLCVLGFIDAVRRRGDPRWIATFVLSLVGVAATAAFFYLVIYPSDGAA